MAAALGAPLRDAASAIQGVPKSAMLAAVKKVKVIAEQEARRDVGGDGAMSHMGYRRGVHRAVKLKLRDDLKVGTGQASAKLTGGPASGAWAIANAGADAHLIGATTTRGARRGQRRRLAFNGAVVYGPVRHPGTKGKGTFDRVVRRAQVEVPKIAADEVARVLGKSLRG